MHTKRLCRDLFVETREIFFSSWISMASSLKKTEEKVELLTNIDMLLMIEKGIRGGICLAIHQYAKTNSQYVKDCDENKESSDLINWNVNNLYGWAMLQKLPVNKFEWIEYAFQFNENVIKNYNKESDEGYFLEVDIQYPKKLHEFHNDLPFLPERIKLEKDARLATNFYDKSGHVIQIRHLKQALNHG